MPKIVNWNLSSASISKQSSTSVPGEAFADKKPSAVSMGADGDTISVW